MNQMPGRCPVCSNALTVTRLQCGQCGTAIEGAFDLGRFQALTPEQLRFVEVFIKNRGKIKDVERELEISYPTVVTRLNEVVRSMGYEVDESALSDVDQFEYYQAQVINPQGGSGHPNPPINPGTPMPPMTPIPPMPPVPPMPPSPRLSPEKRQQVLDDLEAGKITATEALKKLHG